MLDFCGFIIPSFNRDFFLSAHSFIKVTKRLSADSFIKVMKLLLRVSVTDLQVSRDDSNTEQSNVTSCTLDHFTCSSIYLAVHACAINTTEHYRTVERTD